MAFHYHIEMEEPPMDFDEMTCVIFAKSWRTVRDALGIAQRHSAESIGRAGRAR